MRILVTGVSGMLGVTLVKSFSEDFEVYATGKSEYNNCPVPYKIFDLATDNYTELILWSKPEIIIHCGALTNGNYCKDNPLEAFNINGLSVNKLLNSTDSKVKIIFISTDAVFPSALHMAQEIDTVYPENIYGKSKELGEFFLLNSTREFIIIRTTIVGLNENRLKSGFVEWIINSALEKKSIGLFSDVIFSPISIWDLVKEINYLINLNDYSSKILHIAGNEHCSKYEFAIRLLNDLHITTELIKESSIQSFNDRAKRSSDQTLNCSYYEKKYNRKLYSLAETTKSIKLHYNEQH